MNDSPPVSISRTPTSSNDFFKHFWGFDRLMGGTLIKVIYYIGLVLIGLSALFTLLGSFAAGAYGGGLGMLGGMIAAVIILVAGAVFWRFTCELWMLLFLMYDRLVEVRDRLPPRS